MLALDNKQLIPSQFYNAFLHTENLFWLSELLSLCISAVTCLACLKFTPLKGNILLCLLCLIVNNFFHIYLTP